MSPNYGTNVNLILSKSACPRKMNVFFSKNRETNKNAKKVWHTKMIQQNNCNYFTVKPKLNNLLHFRTNEHIYTITMYCPYIISLKAFIFMLHRFNLPGIS